MKHYCTKDSEELGEIEPEYTGVTTAQFKCFECGRLYAEVFFSSASDGAELQLIYDPEWNLTTDATG